MKINKCKQNAISLAAVALFCSGMISFAHAAGTDTATTKLGEETSQSAVKQAASEVVENTKDQANEAVVEAIEAVADKEKIEEQSLETEKIDKEDATGVATDTDEGGSN